MPGNKPAVPEDGPQLRVLFLSWRDDRHPEAGGAEVFLERITTSLARRGHIVTVMAARYPGSLAEERVGRLRMLRRGGRFTVYPRGMRTVLGAGHHYDVIVDIQNGVPFWAPLVTSTPVVNVVHHIHREQWHEVFEPARARLGWWLESRAAPWVYRSSRYVAVSAATRDELVALGVDRDRVSIVYSGLDVSPTVATWRPDGPRRMLVLGRLVPHKRVEIALDVLASLRDEMPDLRLTVAGTGYWLNELVAHAQRRGVADRVRFAGYVSDEERSELLATSTVNLLPSVKEGWGLAIVEAAVLGTPTVAFRDAGGVTESIVDGVTGMLAADPADFRAKVAQLLRDPELRAEMGTKARQHAAVFDWERTTDAFEEVLRTACSGQVTAAEPRPRDRD